MLGEPVLAIAAEDVTFALAASRGFCKLELDGLVAAAEVVTFASVGIDPNESKRHGKF